MNPADAKRRPCRGAAANHLVPAARPERPERNAPDLPDATVRVTEMRVSAIVDVPDATANRVVQQVVPAHRRDRRGPWSWTVYASQLSRLVTALQHAGYRVHRAPRTPAARSASTS